MLRAVHRRLSRFLAIPVLTMITGCVIGTTVSLAGPERAHRSFQVPPAAANRAHVVPVIIGHGERRHVAGHHGRWHRFSYNRRYLAPPSVYLEAANYGYGNQTDIRDEFAVPTPRQYGPISFADLPASTGIRSAPPSPPLFMQLSGRQVVADDGEKYLWRAGPKIVDLDSPVGQRQARQGQPRQAYADMTRLDAPKIIVIRP
jgi:hypothetical protein